MTDIRLPVWRNTVTGANWSAPLDFLASLLTIWILIIKKVNNLFIVDGSKCPNVITTWLIQVWPKVKQNPVVCMYYIFSRKQMLSRIILINQKYCGEFFYRLPFCHQKVRNKYEDKNRGILEQVYSTPQSSFSKIN